MNVVHCHLLMKINFTGFVTFTDFHVKFLSILIPTDIKIIVDLLKIHEFDSFCYILLDNSLKR